MLNNIGLPGLLLLAIVVLVLFGKGKISGVMGEVGKGITSFKKGMDDGRREIEDAAADRARDVTPPPAPQPAVVTPVAETVVPPVVPAAPPAPPSDRDPV